MLHASGQNLPISDIPTTLPAPRILLVEDNPADAELIAEALEAVDFGGALMVIDSGRAALSYLLDASICAHTPMPALVLMDVNLPGLDGIEVLKAVKSMSALEGIPVMMLSSSDAESDIDRSLRAGALAYFVKPSGLRELRQFVTALLLSLGQALQPPVSPECAHA